MSNLTNNSLTSELIAYSCLISSCIIYGGKILYETNRIYLFYSKTIKR